LKYIVSAAGINLKEGEVGTWGLHEQRPTISARSNLMLFFIESFFFTAKEHKGYLKGIQRNNVPQYEIAVPNGHMRD
jgi:hypothetical protein